MPKRILFVCLGNICRSPMAEAVFRHAVESAGLGDQFIVDSAGTGNWHAGENADRRTLAVLASHGIDAPSRARQLRAEDFASFDHIIVMDRANERDVKAWASAQPEKVALMLAPTPHLGDEVPDPYYGSSREFEEVYELLTEACLAWLEKLTGQV